MTREKIFVLSCSAFLNLSGLSYSKRVPTRSKVSFVEKRGIMALHSRFLWQKMRVSLLMAAVGGTFTYFLMRTPVDAFSPAAKVLLSSRHNNYSPTTYDSSSDSSLIRTNDDMPILGRRHHVPKLAKNPQQQEDGDDDTVTAKKRFFGFAVLKRRVKRIFRRRRKIV